MAPLLPNANELAKLEHATAPAAPTAAPTSAPRASALTSTTASSAGGTLFNASGGAITGGLGDAASKWNTCQVAPPQGTGCPGGASHFATCLTYTYTTSPPCPTGDLVGYGVPGSAAPYTTNFPAFQALESGESSVKPFERFFVPYDAVFGAGGPSGCTWSTVLGNSWANPGDNRWHPAAEAWITLYSEVRTALSDGITPMISITGSEDSFEPAEPDPSNASDAANYVCGVRGIISALAQNQLPVNVWEAFNEPDLPATTGTTYAYNTNSSGPLTCASNAQGPAKAACIWRLADNEIRSSAGHGSDTVSAGVISGLSFHGDYIARYLAALSAQGATLPPTFSVHDYADVTTPGTGLAAATDKAISTDYAAYGRPAPYVWISEAGEQQGTTQASPSQEAASARAFLGLPTAAQSTGGAAPVSLVLWYQFQAISQGSSDTGLLTPAPSGSTTGGWRQSYCVVRGIAASNCTG